jgi:hypothetical protein
MTPEQLASLPLDVQTYMLTHNVGDEVRVLAYYTPGDPTPHGPYNCAERIGRQGDVYRIEYSIRTWTRISDVLVGTDAGWLWDAVGWVTTCRDAFDSTYSSTILGRGHDNTGEHSIFNSTAPIGATCGVPYPCWWDRDTRVLPNYVAPIGGTPYGKFITWTTIIPGTLPLINSAAYFNAISFAFQGSVSSAFGASNDCLHVVVTTPEWVATPSLCTYGQPLP